MLCLLLILLIQEPSRPSAAVEGTIWLDTSGAATAQLLKLYDGADDILLGTVNFTAKHNRLGQIVHQKFHLLE